MANGLCNSKKKNIFLYDTDLYLQSEDWGSEHSSGIIGKFLRRDSGMHDRKKKLIGPKFKGVSNGGSTEDVENEQNQIKKPLIAKWKAGANKLHVTCSESDGM